MSKPRIETVEIKIAGRTLTCSPLKRELVGPCWQTVTNLMALQGKQGNEAMKAWLDETRDAIRYIFLCAKPNHPELTLAEIEDELIPEEIRPAIDAIRFLSIQYSKCTGLIQ